MEMAIVRWTKFYRECESQGSKIGDLKSSCPSHVGNVPVIPAFSDLHLGKEYDILLTHRSLSSPYSKDSKHKVINDNRTAILNTT